MWTSTLQGSQNLHCSPSLKSVSVPWDDKPKLSQAGKARPRGAQILTDHKHPVRVLGPAATQRVMFGDECLSDSWGCDNGEEETDSSPSGFCVEDVHSHLKVLR